MSKIKTDDGDRNLFQRLGTGQPIVFHHGWPLSADEWDDQLLFFLEKRLSRRCPRSIESVVVTTNLAFGAEKARIDSVTHGADPGNGIVIQDDNGSAAIDRKCLAADVA